MPRLIFDERLAEYLKSHRLLARVRKLTRKSLQYCLKNTDETIVVKSLMQCFKQNLIKYYTKDTTLINFTFL
jgi:hypothetical protein